tara:strand:+ start:606 stop:758 length:153 start_codon:yes stop_codon:yes gene_type:complete
MRTRTSEGLSIRLTTEMKHDVLQLSKDLDAPIAEVIREALGIYINKNKKK